jgi:hypothetical protein
VSKSEGQGGAGVSTERIRFINHQGKRILLADFSNCSASEVEKISRRVPDHVTVQPRGSVLILSDFNGASFDHDALRTMKESAVFDKPFVKKSAVNRNQDSTPGVLRADEELLPPRVANFCNSRRGSGLAGRAIALRQT